MPKQPFKSDEYYDQNDDDSDELNVEDMEKIISFVGGETDENPFSARATTSAVGGYGRSTSTDSTVRGNMANRTNFPNGRVVKMTKKELRDMSIEEANEFVEDGELIEPIEDDDGDEIEEVSTTAGIAGLQAPLGSEIWGGKLQHKYLDGWREVEEEDVEEPNMKKSYKSSTLHKNQGRNKRENKEMGDDKKVIRLTEEQLEQIIKEGFFSQLFTKAAGKVAGTKTAAGGWLTKKFTNVDPSLIKSPEVVKQATMASKTITTFKEKFAKLLLSYTDDIIGVFGEDPENMPEEIKSSLGAIDTSSTEFVKALDSLIEIVDKLK